MSFNKLTPRIIFTTDGKGWGGKTAAKEGSIRPRLPTGKVFRGIIGRKEMGTKDIVLTICEGGDQ